METLTETLEEDVFDSKSLDNETEFKTLVRSIKLSDGFSLFFARSNEVSEQKKLAENLEKEFSDRNIKVIFIGKMIKHLLDELREILHDEKPFAVFIYGLNDSFPSDVNSPKNTFIKNLNASRNSFPKIIDCPLVLFVPDFAITAIMRGANDFFSVRSGVFYFESKKDNKESQTGQIISTNNYEIGSLTIQERRERIKTIQDLLRDEKDKERQIKLHLRLGELYFFSAEYEKAETEFNSALNLSQALNNSEVKATSYNNLAELYRTQGRYEEAEPLFKQALAIREKVSGENHPSTAGSYNNLALLYYSQGRYEEAEPLYKQALAISEKLLGENHPDTATCYNNLALLYRTQGRYEEAEPLYKQALAIREKVLGENHPDTAGSYNNLAVLYYSQGRYEEAEPLYKQALAISEKLLGENHPDTAQSYMNLGAFYYDRGKSQEGLELCKKALKIYRNTLPAGHPRIQSCENWVKIIKNSMVK